MFFVGIVALFWLIPIAAGIWAIITLQRLRSGQEKIQLQLEMLERLVQRGSGQ